MKRGVRGTPRAAAASRVRMVFHAGEDATWDLLGTKDAGRQGILTRVPLCDAGGDGERWFSLSRGYPSLPRPGTREDRQQGSHALRSVQFQPSLPCWEGINTRCARTQR